MPLARPGGDEDDAGEGEEDEKEPGVAISRPGENDPVADEETNQGEQAGEQKALPEGEEGGHAAVDIIRPRQGDGCRRGRAVGEGDVDLEDVAGVALGDNGGPLGEAAVGLAVEGHDAIAGGKPCGASFRLEAGFIDAARIGVEAEGDIDALVPVDARVPEIDDARDPVAQTGDDPESQKKAQKIG